MCSNRFESGLLNAESEAGRETHAAHHAEFVLREAAPGLTDGANDPGFQVGLPADKVENFAAVVTHQQAVDGEVAALHVFLRRPRINHAVWMTAIAVTHIRAEGGHFYFQAIPRNQDDTELRAHGHALWK